MMYIYSLSSSTKPEAVRYIGKTIDTVMRLYRHKLSKIEKRQSTYVNRWIAKEQRAGNDILLKVVAYVDDSIWQEEEQRYIALYREQGHRLTNTALGGDGPNGYRHTNSAKAKISAAGFNRKVKPETKAKIAKARIGMIFSPEHKAKLAEARKLQKPTNIIPVYQIMPNQQVMKHDSISLAAAVTGASASAISAVCKGHRKTAGGFAWSYMFPQPELLDMLNNLGK